jgi:uncharacterized surface protein with fasciclin (FAS1) repeats
MRRNNEIVTLADVPLDGFDMGTALEVLAAYDDASRFYDAAVAAGLTDLLIGADVITVFAPPNAAFDAVLVEQGITLQNTDALRDLLQSYILSGDFPIVRLMAETGITHNGEVMQIQYAPDGQLRANNIRIHLTDIRVSNGTLHILGGVFGDTSAP